MRSLIGSAIGLFLIRIVGVILLIVQVAVVAYFEGLEVVGLNGILWSSVVIFRVAGPLGIDVMALKDACNPKFDNYSNYVPSLARRDTKALLKIWIPILGIGAGGWSISIAFDLVDGVLVPVTALACFASAFHRLWFMSLISRQKPYLSQILESILLPVLALAAVLVTPRGNETTFLIGQGIAICAVSLLLGAAALARSNKHGKGLPPTNWRGGLAVALGASLTALAVRSPIFIVGSGSVRLAGEYDIAQRFQSAGSIGVSAVSTALMPRLAKSIQHDETKLILRLLITGGAISASIPAVLLSLLLVSGRDFVAQLLGDEYGALWGAAVVLTAASLVNALTSSVSNALSLGRRERWFAWISGIQLSLIIAAAFVLGSPLPEQMAFVVLISELIRSVLLVTALFGSGPHKVARHRATG